MNKIKRAAKPWLKKIFKKKSLTVFFITAVLIMISFILINCCVNLSTKSQIYKDVNEVPSKQTALLLGALVYQNGGLSSTVKDRADTAIELYKAKKVEKILVSGDHGRKNYDEVNTIKDYLLKNGVQESDVFMDHAGFDTYDSLYRSDYIFEVESLIIISQEFHLPRSLYLANSLDIDAVGIVSDKQVYVTQSYNKRREFLATIKAFLDASFNTKPKFLGEKIPITGDSKKSWD